MQVHTYTLLKRLIVFEVLVKQVVSGLTQDDQETISHVTYS